MNKFIMRRDGVHRPVCLSEMKELFGMDDKSLESLFTKQLKYEYQHKLKHDKCNVKNFRDCDVCKIFELLVEDAKRVLSSEMINRAAKQLTANRKNHQAHIAKREYSMQLLQNENKHLHQRIKQYEHLLEGCMRKVDNVLVEEYKLRDEVLMLKNRVCDLEGALIASATKEDVGYCTMSSSRSEPYFTEIEDWSMSQKEIETAFEEDSIGDNWLSKSTHQSGNITTLLQDQIVFSDDEGLTCKNFTPDFYRLSNIPESGTRRLKSQQEPQFDSSWLCSPTPSEVEQITSCPSNHSGQNVQSIVENIPTLHNPKLAAF